MTRAGRGRADARRIGWPGVVAGVALMLVAMVAGTAAAPAARAASGAACGRVAGPFTVHGTQVLGQGGQVFVSYGITVPGLQLPDWAQLASLDQAKIAAVATDWCANTVRLQVSQDNLLGPSGTGFDQAFMAQVESEVSAAESYDMVVVINDQTEYAAPAVRSTQRGPTAATKTFWKEMAAVFGNDPQVIFDLFNEPRTYSDGMSQAQEWQLWLNGGRFDGVTYPFGMAQLADYVRNTLRVGNLFWVEGPDNAESFAGMVSHGALLKTSGVVYAVHHPAGPHDAAAWDADFGYLVDTGVAPVVDGEWTNYEPAPTRDFLPLRTSCWPDARTAVPAYLQYLAAHGIGLNAYQLQPGYLIKSYGNLADPTTINGRTWSCLSNQESRPGQGAGSELMAWFEQHNS